MACAPSPPLPPPSSPSTTPTPKRPWPALSRVSEAAEASGRHLCAERASCTPPRGRRSGSRWCAVTEFLGQVPLLLCLTGSSIRRIAEAVQVKHHVFVASDRFLLDTLIQTVAAAMASTLKRSYLSIYNWSVLFRRCRVQVLYYALLRKGHLDVYVASREAAPPRARQPSDSTIDQLSVKVEVGTQPR